MWFVRNDISRSRSTWVDVESANIFLFCKKTNKLFAISLKEVKRYLFFLVLRNGPQLLARASTSLENESFISKKDLVNLNMKTHFNKNLREEINKGSSTIE